MSQRTRQQQQQFTTAAPSTANNNTSSSFFPTLLAAFRFTQRVAHIFWNTFSVIISYIFAKTLFAKFFLSQHAEEIRRAREELTAKREAASTYEEWRRWAREIDDLDGYQTWRTDEETKLFNFDETASRIRTLTELRQRRDYVNLLTEISADFHRRMCGITNPLLYSKYTTGTKTAVKSFVTLMQRLLGDLAATDHHHYSDEKSSNTRNDIKTTIKRDNLDDEDEDTEKNVKKEEQNQRKSVATTKKTSSSPSSHHHLTREMKLTAISDLSRSYGHTALILNSSAAFGMYHLGIIKVLYESQVLPRVIFGRSSGAIAAAFLCCSENVEESMLDTDKIDTSAFSKREEIAGPGFWRRIKRFFTEGTLMDVRVLQQFVTDNLGDITFEEAYRKTGRVLNIFVARRIPETNREAGWLLNYLTAPDITVASAAVASCATTGVYAEVPLLQKNYRRGTVVECIPSSLQWTAVSSVFHVNRAISRIRHLFNVNFFIVADASFMHLPFLTFRGSKTMLGKFISFTSEEVWRFCGTVARLFRTKHAALFDALNELPEGDVMLFPVTSISEAFECLTNPSRGLLAKCRSKGEKIVWPRLEEIKANMLIEVALHDALVELHGSRALNEIHDYTGETAFEHYTF